MCSVVELVVKLGDVGKALVFISIKYALYSLGKVENVLTVENSLAKILVLQSTQFRK